MKTETENETHGLKKEYIAHLRALYIELVVEGCIEDDGKMSMHLEKIINIVRANEEST